MSICLLACLQLWSHTPFDSLVYCSCCFSSFFSCSTYRASYLLWIFWDRKTDFFCFFFFISLRNIFHIRQQRRLKCYHLFIFSIVREIVCLNSGNNSSEHESRISYTFNSKISWQTAKEEFIYKCEINIDNNKIRKDWHRLILCE